MSLSDIASVKPGYCTRKSRHTEESPESGEFVTMKNGAVWFHPYNGRAPFKVESATPESL